MKKGLKLSLIIAFFFTAVFINAYDKIEKIPTPKGGMQAIMNNIQYPDQAKKDNIQGKVVISAVVNTEGKVIKTTIIESAGALLDKAAKEAIEKTEFIPGEKDGVKIQAEVKIPVSFK